MLAFESGYQQGMQKVAWLKPALIVGGLTALMAGINAVSSCKGKQDCKATPTPSPSNVLNAAGTGGVTAGGQAQAVKAVPTTPTAP